ncbi:MAG: hypothetical protein JSR85_03960 [Proteobacteria bacterium]|nr:hypothetical protein [Pseudomonadota bacterium]
MKKFFTKKVFFIGGSLCCVIGFLLFIFLDAFYGSNFRSMQDPIFSTQSVDVRGLRELQASGGTSVRFIDLQSRLRHITGPKIIVDGMAEFHGYINGIPSTFFGYQRGRAPSFKHLIRRWIFTGTTEICPELVTPEALEAQKYGFEYKKVNIGSKFIETDQNIDEIVAFYDSIPKDAWLHFHCAHGKGRTSILLVMLDTLRNAPQVSLEDIVTRQYLLGSEDLLNTEVWKNGTYNKRKLEARKKFVEEFYLFAVQRKAGGIQKWSDWHSLQAQSGGIS